MSSLLSIILTAVSRRILFAALLCSALIANASSARAQGVAYIREHYAKYDYDVPMRDGTRLFTSVYVPTNSDAPQPIMLIRTPYSIAPYGEDEYPKTLGPSEKFAREGYIFAYQDVRGRFHSTGVMPKFAEKLAAAGIPMPLSLMNHSQDV